MRRDRKNKIRRERMIMIASSALVMGALTMTGIYMKEKTNTDDGYSIDFSALEDSADNKVQEIAQGKQMQEEEPLPDLGLTADAGEPEGDTDTDAPLAAGSNLVEIPGLTDSETLLEGIDLDGRADEMTQLEETADTDKDNEQDSREQEKDQDEEEAEASSATATASRELHFSEAQGLIRPVSGEVLLHYSMDKGIYFSTLDQYKYNPAVMLGAEEGEAVSVCADAKVISVFYDEEIGDAVTLDLGDGYQATYGQLQDIQAAEGSYVNQGEILGSAAAPTKYFTLEGTNVYFQLTKDGDPVNPEELFR